MLKENGMYYGVKDHSYPSVMRMPSYERPLGIEVPTEIRHEICAKTVEGVDESYRVLLADTELSEELKAFIDKCWLEVKLKDKSIF